MAVLAMRDPTLLAGLIATTDEMAGPEVRVASLQRQLAEVQAARDKLLSQLERLDADDPLVADYQDKLRRNHALRATLTEALAAAQTAVETAAARQATLEAFRAYAAQRCGLRWKWS